MNLFTPEPLAVTLRDYQREAHEESFRLWESGVRGTLIRSATGTGKTIMSCVNIRRWLDRGPGHKALVLSYERQLVWQFAEEIEDVMGIRPGIEMEKEELHEVPDVVVASRQTLMPQKLASPEQKDAIANLGGIDDVGLLTFVKAKSALAAIRAGADLQDVADEITRFNEDYRCNHETGQVARLHKFDWRDNWLLICDEAHRYAKKLRSCGPLFEWFERNPEHRKSGITATPQRSDKVSIGHVFPGIALDYPLFTPNGKCAVNDGYAVPYVQKFIRVESIDFAAIKNAAAGSQKKWDSEVNAVLNEEKELAKLCEPMLDLAGDRKTLIFSPSVEMAENVARYINARTEVECECGHRGWYPSALVGDGTKCRECERLLPATEHQNQAWSIHGGTPEKTRREVYRGHREGRFRFLSVCGLCREGFNSPTISCVAIFRPVSKAASALAEQMKGRGCRVLPNTVDGLETAEERLNAIAASDKPDCMIIDLVGVTGLSDCASTIQIYAEGKPDQVIDLAEKLSVGGVEDPVEAIEQAEKQIEEERVERERREQERAVRRSRSDPRVKYTTHDVGMSANGPRDPKAATEKQIKYIRILGMEFVQWEPSKLQAGRIITLLKDGQDAQDVAYQCGIKSDQWKPAGPSVAQIRLMARLGIDHTGMSFREACQAIDAKKNGKPAVAIDYKVIDDLRQGIADAYNHDQLTEVARRVKSSEMEEKTRQELYRLGARKRAELNEQGEF